MIQSEDARRPTPTPWVTEMIWLTWRPVPVHALTAARSGTVAILLGAPGASPGQPVTAAIVTPAATATRCGERRRPFLP